MKALKSSLAALILIAHCYVPAVAAISALSERGLRFNGPLTASIFTFILTAAIYSYLFIDQKDVTLPFIQLIVDGRVIWSGKIEYPASDSEDVTLTWPSGSPIDRLWLDNGTVIADGEEITVR